MHSRRVGFRRDRERERERAADAGLGLDPEPAVVVLDDLAADREAKACALRLVQDRIHLADLLEFAEHHLLVLWRDADAGVGQRDANLVLDAMRREANLALARELQRV